MRSPRLYWPLVIIAVISAMVVYSHSVIAANEDDKAQPQEHSFAGKLVVIIIDESNAVERSQNTEVLQNAVVRQIGGRYFITGLAYSPPEVASNWRTGAEVGLAWERVQTYYAYTPEQFKNYAKNWAESDEDE